MSYNRLIKIPDDNKRSFFLWGPRQSGKTFFLKIKFPDAHRVDLLKTDRYIELNNEPHRLREEVLSLRNKSQLVIIDEVQKIPLLLDEVHWLIENTDHAFALLGSSARKLKRGHGNLLGGRAIRYELSGLVSQELGDDFNLERIINHGYLPNHYIEDSPRLLIKSYVSDYLKEEIAEEGLVRSLQKFSRFLEIAALSDTQIVNYTNISNDCSVSAPTVKDYFQILVDTLLGNYLNSYQNKVKRKIIKAPKFYLFDIGVVNFLSRKPRILFGSNESGPALENWLFHEIRTYNNYSQKDALLSYWHLADSDNIEVDFIVGEMETAIECKATKRAVGHHFKSLHQIKQEHPSIKRRILACLEPRRRTLEDGIEVIPFGEFVKELWEGGIF